MHQGNGQEEKTVPGVIDNNGEGAPGKGGTGVKEGAAGFAAKSTQQPSGLNKLQGQHLEGAQQGFEDLSAFAPSGKVARSPPASSPLEEHPDKHAQEGDEQDNSVESLEQFLSGGNKPKRGDGDAKQAGQQTIKQWEDLEMSVSHMHAQILSGKDYLKQTIPEDSQESIELDEKVSSWMAKTRGIQANMREMVNNLASKVNTSSRKKRLDEVESNLGELSSIYEDLTRRLSRINPTRRRLSFNAEVTHLDLSKLRTDLYKMLDDFVMAKDFNAYKEHMDTTLAAVVASEDVPESVVNSLAELKTIQTTLHLKTEELTKGLAGVKDSIQSVSHDIIKNDQSIAQVSGRVDIMDQQVDGIRRGLLSVEDKVKQLEKSTSLQSRVEEVIRRRTQDQACNPSQSRSTPEVHNHSNAEEIGYPPMSTGNGQTGGQGAGVSSRPKSSLCKTTSGFPKSHRRN